MPRFNMKEQNNFHLQFKKSMNYYTARKILDLVREGRDYPVFIINQALYIVSELTEEEYEKTKQIQA